MTDAAETLRANVDKLPERDKSFAQSLLAARRPTEKQLYWIGKLAERVAGTAPERESAVIGDMSPVVAMFKHYAANHVKLPRIVLQPDGMGLFALHMAGTGSAYPGCIQVKEYEGDRKWFGRIYPDGRFELSPKYTMAQVQPILQSLRDLAADPLGEAQRSARLTGRCCFCHIRLKDERSTEMGYGPQCAENFGLDWGRRKFTFAATPVEVVQAPAQPRFRTPQRRIKVRAA